MFDESDRRIVDFFIASSSQASYQPHTLVATGHQIGTPAPLVSLISEELIEDLRARWDHAPFTSSHGV